LFYSSGLCEDLLAFYYRERENEQRASELVELRRSSERTDEVGGEAKDVHVDYWAGLIAEDFDKVRQRAEGKEIDWCKEGVGAKDVTGKIGTLTMAPGNDERVKLIWDADGKTSSYLKARRLWQLDFKDKQTHWKKAELDWVKAYVHVTCKSDRERIARVVADPHEDTVKLRWYDNDKVTVLKIHEMMGDKYKTVNWKKVEWMKQGVCVQSQLPERFGTLQGRQTEEGKVKVRWHGKSTDSDEDATPLFKSKWEERKSATHQGRIYYVNPETKERSWYPPGQSVQSVQDTTFSPKTPSARSGTGGVGAVKGATWAVRAATSLPASVGSMVVQAPRVASHAIMSIQTKSVPTADAPPVAAREYEYMEMENPLSSSGASNHVRQADADSNGQVTQTEALAFLVTQGYVASELQGFLEGFWIACHVDDNSTLDADEFATLFRAVEAKFLKGGHKARPRLAKPPDSLETIFREIDTDRSGQLEIGEFTAWWGENGGDLGCENGRPFPSPQFPRMKSNNLPRQALRK
jgi:hypothetical protein